MDATTATTRTSLRTKITRRVLVVALVPLLLVGGIATLLVQNLSRSASAEVEASKQRLVDDFVGPGLALRADLVASDIDAFLAGEIAKAKLWANNPVVIEAAKVGSVEAINRDYVEMTVEQVEAEFPDDVDRSLGISLAANRYVRDRVRESAHFAEVFFTEKNGFNVAISNQTGDFVQAGEGWWDAAMANGIDIGEIEFDESAGLFSADVSVRIDDPFSDNPLGVLKAVLSVSVFQELADDAVAGFAGEAVVAAPDGRLLAETASDHDPARIFTEDVVLDDVVAVDLDLDGVEGAGAVVGDQVSAGYAVTAGAEVYDEVAPGFTGFGLRVVMSEDTAVALAPLVGLDELRDDVNAASSTVLLVTVIALLAAAGVAAAVAVRMARGITEPVLRLRDVAEQVSMGDLDTEVDVDSDDEIGELAESFDRLVTSVKFLSMTADDETAF